MMWDQVLVQDEVAPYWVITVSVSNLLNIVGQYLSQIRHWTADNIENIDIGLHIGEYRPENYILLFDIKEFEDTHSFLAILTSEWAKLTSSIENYADRIQNILPFLKKKQISFRFQNDNIVRP